MVWKSGGVPVFFDVLLVLNEDVRAILHVDGPDDSPMAVHNLGRCCERQAPRQLPDLPRPQCLTSVIRTRRPAPCRSGRTGRSLASPRCSLVSLEPSCVATAFLTR